MNFVLSKITHIHRYFKISSAEWQVCLNSHEKILITFLFYRTLLGRLSMNLCSDKLNI